MTRGKALAGQVDFTFLLKDISSLERSAIAEVFGVDAGIAEIVVDEHGGLAGEFETLAALVAGNEIVKANHEGSGFCEFATVLLARGARQFLFLAADLPTNGRFEFATATWTDQLDFACLFSFRIEGSLVHLTPRRYRPLQ